jgi:two-component system response regulator
MTMGKTLNVLIVEDSEDDALLLVLQLRQAGYEPVYGVVASADAMTEALDRTAWDIVISDYSLPGFGGLEALKMVKERKIDIPFIIVSGVIGEQTAVEAMKGGAHDYVMKGDLTRLVPAIERELREAQVRRDRKQSAEVLKETQRRLITLLSNLPGMAYRCRNDKDWTMEFVSEGCMDITGYPPDDLIDNKTVSYGDLIHEEDRGHVWGEIQKALEAKEHFQIFYRIRTAGGEEKWVWEKGRGVYSLGGELVALEGFISDITEQRKNQEKIKASLQEKVVMLKEIHHRVKNNLQVIYSLLNLQSGYIRDPEAQGMFRECQGRVKSMALIHEVLYRSEDMARVGFADYVRTLVENLYRSYGFRTPPISLQIDVKDVMLELDTAIPCGLIINELVSNAFKYAFSEGQAGEIYVGICPIEGDRYRLTVRDNGKGFPEEIDFRNTESLGLQLVNTLTGQLGGSIELNLSGGTEFVITFTDQGAIKRRQES